jgi:metallo-beta-lactamase class B
MCKMRNTDSCLRRRWFAILGAAVFCAALAVPLRGQSNPEWTNPFPPFRIIGNVYYVGSEDLAAYLITTSEGNILINSNLESSVPQIKESVEKLGFKFSDIKILLISHAHWDHCAGSAALLKLTHAKYMVMEGDVPVVESGGRDDFNYGSDKSTYFPPAKVNRVLHDGDTVTLGGVTLTAHLTAGHTKGCTTWTMVVRDGKRDYHVVIVGSPNVNPGFKLVNNSKYPQIAQDYERGFKTLKSLPCDVFLGAHGGYYGMKAKYARMKKTGPNPFIDPQGYQKFVAEKHEAFRAELAKQRAGAK